MLESLRNRSVHRVHCSSDCPLELGGATASCMLHLFVYLGPLTKYLHDVVSIL